jgi:ABC-2 type transport system permease protein
MLKSLFAKTLYEKRWGIFWWSLAMFAFTMSIILLFPTFRDSFGQSLTNVPDSLKAILGEAQDYQQINGFLHLQVFMQMIFLTLIYGIILFSGLIAGEENDGTLQSLLAQPISRTKVYFQKLGAGAVIIGIVSLAMFAATWLGTVMIGDPVSPWRALQATFSLWLASMVLSTVAYSLGSATGRRGIAGALAGVYAFMGYMVFTLANTVKALEIPNYFAPFRYFASPRVLDSGLSLQNVAVLSAVCGALIIIGWLVFRKRDIYQR